MPHLPAKSTNWPQWGPAAGPESVGRAAVPDDGNRASMGSGRGGRNQGSGKTGPVTRHDTASCERCPAGGVRGVGGQWRDGGDRGADLRASAPRGWTQYRTARRPTRDLGGRAPAVCRGVRGCGLWRALRCPRSIWITLSSRRCLASSRSTSTRRLRRWSCRKGTPGTAGVHHCPAWGCRSAATASGRQVVGHQVPVACLRVTE